MEIPIGFAQANFRFTGLVAPTGAEVTLGIDISQAAGGPVDVALELANLWETHILPLQNQWITLAEVLVKYGPNATGPSAASVSGASGAGSGNPEPPNTALLVQKETPVGGRAGRGRMYVPGIGEDTVGPDGSISGAVVAAWQSGFNAFHGDLLAADLTPVLLHGANSPIQIPSPINQFTVTNRGATQRRRMRR